MIASAFFMLTVLRHVDVTKEHLIRVVNVSVFDFPTVPLIAFQQPYNIPLL